MTTPKTNNGCEQCESDREGLLYLESKAGAPLLTPDQYCEKLRTYIIVLEACAKEGHGGPISPAMIEQIGAAARLLDFAAAKSNLLFRLMYLKEDLRQIECPTHKGHWSGLAFGDDRCECEDAAGNLTGWLPNE